MAKENDVIKVAGSSRVFSRTKVLLVLMIPLAMALMAVSSINVCLPTIEDGLNATTNQIQWILSGYALAFGISLVPCGRLGDLFGRGSMWILGVLIFTSASLLCGLAPSADLLVTGRIIQGVGAGIFNPQTTGMIQQYFSGAARARAYSLFGMVVSASVAFGPAVSGIVIQMIGVRHGWRGAFLWNVPLGILGIIAAAFWFPFERERERRAKRKQAITEQNKLDLDPIGMLLLMFGVLAIMFPFMSRESPWIWALVPAGLALMAIWVGWEKRYKAHGNQPMVDMELFSHLSFSYGTAASATMFLGSTSIFAVMAIFLQSGHGVSAFHAGFIGLPNAICSATASIWAGKRALTNGRPIVIAALTLITVGPIGCLTLGFGVINHGWSFWLLTIPLAIQGLGQGAMGAINQTLSMIDIPVEDGGTAGGLKNTAERITTAVGNAMITAVLFSLVERGWAVALAGAYSVIAAILFLAVGIAVADLRRNGVGAPGYLNAKSASKAG